MKIQARILALVFFLFHYALSGQGLPTASPEKAGLSSERLNRIRSVMHVRRYTRLSCRSDK